MHCRRRLRRSEQLLNSPDCTSRCGPARASEEKVRISRYKVWMRSVLVHRWAELLLGFAAYPHRSSQTDSGPGKLRTLQSFRGWSCSYRVSLSQSATQKPRRQYMRERSSLGRKVSCFTALTHDPQFQSAIFGESM